MNDDESVETYCVGAPFEIPIFGNLIFEFLDFAQIVLRTRLQAKGSSERGAPMEQYGDF
jgi:hypothetical protein